ncbi:gene transfer agent family protein [Aquibium sp. LZ166]|uniref:Gene transfer agent family protein n=1 Tax=Aquibium pacificus TaxID=3153579 RepID=A0ABV3SQR8_9HYPH
MTHVAFFGDGERSFALPPELIMELERKTGAGIGLLCRRVFARDFALADLLETIRLALIGGGASPKEAADLIAAYGAPRPISETFPLAAAILETVFFGSATKLDDANG